MSCRTGPLRSATPQTKTCLRGPRFARPLRGLYTGLATAICDGPRDARDYHLPAILQDILLKDAASRPA
jgi:hypothetical protein